MFLRKNEILSHELLQEDISYEQAIELQKKWRKIMFEKQRDKKKYWNFTNEDNIRYIAGVDISYAKLKESKIGVACAILWDLNQDQMVEYELIVGEVVFPYISGLLGFRESKLITKTILKLSFLPDLIICDGHGLIHPRRFGEAVQLGAILEIPTFGVAKTHFIGNSNWQTMERKRGNQTPVRDKEEILGYAICSNKNCKPIFVSEGYLIQIDLAIKLTLKMTKNHRIPEPIFLADQISRKKLSEMK